MMSGLEEDRGTGGEGVNLGQFVIEQTCGEGLTGCNNADYIAGLEGYQVGHV
jgi:hypothetical protein